MAWHDYTLGDRSVHSNGITKEWQASESCDITVLYGNPTQSDTSEHATHYHIP